LAPDGKRRLTDVLDYDGVVLLAKSFPNTRASRFVEWFTNSDETIDGKSKSKACNRYTGTFSDDRETFMKGIDYSYYYEQED
jgi:cell filamentation protein